jgi:hypothetical protein
VTPRGAAVDFTQVEFGQPHNHEQQEMVIAVLSHRNIVIMDQRIQRSFKLEHTHTNCLESLLNAILTQQG